MMKRWLSLEKLLMLKVLLIKDIDKNLLDKLRRATGKDKKIC